MEYILDRTDAYNKGENDTIQIVEEELSIAFPCLELTRLKYFSQLIGATASEVGSILELDPFELRIDSINSTAEAHITHENDRFVMVLDNEYLQKVIEGESENEMINLKATIAHECFHILQMKRRPNFIREIKPYANAPTIETYLYQWNRYLPEYAAELFTYNYLSSKYETLSCEKEKNSYYFYLADMKIRLEKMKNARKICGRSYGIKN